MTTTHREVERKFRVDPDFALPNLVGVGGVASVQLAPAMDMAATYHDTADLALIRWRTTLRRRTGGHDDGWHLKLPVGKGTEARDEVHVPLEGSSADQVPAALADIVAPLTRGATLQPTATVRVRRVPRLLFDESGVPLLELVDDAVRIEAAGGSIAAQYRELEVEVIAHDHPGAMDALAAIGELLLEAGATTSSVSKAAAALGPLAAQPPDVPELPIPGLNAPAIDLVRAVLAQHVRRLLLADVGVRRDLPDSVHQMRVAARRLRSVLRTCDPVLDAEWSGSLREELRWLANELGAIRDTEVLQLRLDEHAAALGEPDDAVARAAIDVRLGARLATARSSALAALRSDRHTWLLEDLVAAVHDPRVNADAFHPADAMLLPLVRKTVRRFIRAAASLDRDDPDEQWHEVRIKAKRARYAVEALAGAPGSRLSKIVDALTRATESLGEHQDAAVAMHTLRELSATATGVEGLAFGRLVALEGELQMHVRRTFLTSRSAIARVAHRSGMVSS